jgi:hypothetical protein
MQYHSISSQPLIYTSFRLSQCCLHESQHSADSRNCQVREDKVNCSVPRYAINVEPFSAREGVQRLPAPDAKEIY